MINNVLEWLEQSAKISCNTVKDLNEEISYLELLNNAKRVGSKLVKLINNNEPVVIMMDKGVKTLCAFFGIVMAGGFYSLMNLEQPLKRLEHMKETLNASYIITNKENYEKAQSLYSDDKILLIEDLLNEDIDESKLLQRRSEFYDTMPLYVNFTSGSTGNPKGVVISHKSVIDFINVFVDEFNINENDTIANQAPFDFDVSVKDIYSSLKVGAKLVIVPKEYFSRPKDLLDYICDNKVTTLIWAVSALCLITTFHGLDYRLPGDINKVLFSGEQMPIKHLKEWMSKLVNTTFINLYGPTEITCNCTYYRVNRDFDFTSKLPIGKAFKNEKVFLLDENNSEVKDKNINGEICVSGTCVSLGYYGQNEITSQKFMQNPLNNKYNEIIYRTGDLAYYNENNDLVFVGRKDFQIKYRGHRVELEEIEQVINGINGIKRCICVFDEQKSKIYAFYVGSVDKLKLHELLTPLVPVYMIPSKFTQLEELPLTKNGKIDRNTLLQSERK